MEYNFIFYKNKTKSLFRTVKWIMWVLICVICSTAQLLSQSNTIKGRVTNAFGTPINGAAIAIEDGSNGTITDIEGKYVIDLKSNQSKLTISEIGYITQTIEIKDQTNLDIVLSFDLLGEESIIDIGFGTINKKYFLGSSSQINVKKIENETTSNMADLLRGHLPGLLVGFSTSAKGLSNINLPTQVRTRLGSEVPNSSKLIVDGMVISGELTDINPYDIATIDYLKDATSATVNGSTGYNSIIMVTTKRGKIGKPRVNVSSTVGFVGLSGQELNPLNGQQYIDRRISGYKIEDRNLLLDKPNYFDNPNHLPSEISIDEWKAYDGSSSNTNLIDIWLKRLNFNSNEIANYKSGNTTNWKDYLFQRGIRHNHNISISGANNNLNYYWSIGYVNNEGYEYNDRWKALRSRLNLEINVADFLKFGTNIQFVNKDKSALKSNDNLEALSPYSSFYNNDGATIPTYVDNDYRKSWHPWADVEYIDRFYNRNNILSKIYGIVTLPLGFTFSSEITPYLEYDREYTHWEKEHPKSSYVNGIAERRNYSENTWTFSNILKWNRTVNHHLFDFTVIHTKMKMKSWANNLIQADFFFSDVLGYHQIGGALETLEISSLNLSSSNDAVLARLNYGFKNKYLFSSAYRRQDYSLHKPKFSDTEYGSLSLGWLISEEKFFKAKSIDLLKGSLAYRNSNARYLTYIINNERNEIWEQTNAFTLGLDFSLKKGRINGNVEVYYANSKGSLFEENPTNPNNTSILLSYREAIANRGFEIIVNSINISHPNFTWTNGFSMAFNRNKIVSLYNDEDIESNGWFIGRSFDQIWDYNVLGIWQEEERELAYKNYRAPGDFKLQDVNNDGDLTNADKTFQGYKQPQLILTLRNDLSYKNWDLSMKLYSYLGYFSENNHKINNDVFYDQGSSYNVPYWTPENPINEWARVNSYETGVTIYENNSFIRLDNIALSYSVPSSMLEAIHIRQARVSFIIQNPAVWAPNWSWMDPEQKGYTASSYTIKLNFTL